MIGEKERYHGSAIARLIQFSKLPVKLEFLGGSSYRVNSDRFLYLKYSTKRLSPWSFTFSEDHQAELANLTRRRGRVVVGLVCGPEGVAASYWTELRSALTLGRSGEQFAVRVTRRDGHQFRVGGNRSDPVLVAESDFVRLALQDRSTVQ